MSRGPATPMSRQDRVELLLDVDRDYATYYMLVVDHRGWTAETCWHDPTWNPGWFVATGGDEKSWTAEAAIPLAELSAARAHPGPWACTRISRRGFQSWTAPARRKSCPKASGA